jgi:hypothetical protein
MASMLYSLIRLVLDAIATSHSNEAKLRAEVLASRRQVQVLERQAACKAGDLGLACLARPYISVDPVPAGGG